MAYRGPLGGRFGLVVLAIALAPAVIRRSKSLSKYLGDQLVDLGEFLRKDTDVVPPPQAAPEATVGEPVTDGVIIDEVVVVDEPAVNEAVIEEVTLEEEPKPEE